MPISPGRPALLVFDVNETLSDMTPLGERFADLGVPASLSTTWFAGLLRDGFALAVGGASVPFADLAVSGLRAALRDRPLDRDLDDAVAHVMAGFSALDVHPDVATGIPTLAAAGLRLVTLSNGAASVARELTERAEISAHVEAMLSVEQAGIWKPAHAAYAYGCAATGVEPGEAMLVAVHPWDIDGAARAGLRTCWINRTDATYPAYFREPELAATGLDDLATQLMSG